MSYCVMFRSKCIMMFFMIMNMMISINQQVNGQILCDLVLNRFDDNLICECQEDFSIRNGLEFALKCSYETKTCFDENNQFCGKPNLETTLYRRGSISKTLMTFDADIIPANGGFFGSQDIDPKPITIEITHRRQPLAFPMFRRNLITYASCTAKMGDTNCQSCSICTNQKQVRPDCSNVSMTDNNSNFTPKFTKCIGIENP